MKIYHTYYIITQVVAEFFKNFIIQFAPFSWGQVCFNLFLFLVAPCKGQAGATQTLNSKL